MALGRFGGGKGTLDSPYLIEDAFDLNAIRYNIYNKHCYRLVNDINLCELPKYNEKGWEPIEIFSGYIDGNFHSIWNLYIDSNDDNVGFIKYFDKSKGSTSNCSYKFIENLNIENAEIHGKGAAAILAGKVFFYGNNTTSYEYYWGFSGVTVNGKVYGNNIGGLIGEIIYNPNSYITMIKDCRINVEAYPTKENCSVGLICGIDRSFNHSDDYYCYVYNSILTGKVIQENENNTPIINIDKYNIENKSGNYTYYPLVTKFSKCYCNELNYNIQKIPNDIEVLNDKELYNELSYMDIRDDKVYKLNGSYIQSKELDEKYWAFENNKAPDLFFTNNNNNINIRIKDKFYTYDETTSSFVEIDIPNLLDSDEIKKYKIQNLNVINTAAYIKLLENFKDEDLSGEIFIYNSKKSPSKFITESTQNKFRLIKDNDIVLKNKNKEIQKKTFSFDDDLANEFSLCNKREDIDIKEANN